MTAMISLALLAICFFATISGHASGGGVSGLGAGGGGAGMATGGGTTSSSTTENPWNRARIFLALGVWTLALVTGPHLSRMTFSVGVCRNPLSPGLALRSIIHILPPYSSTKTLADI
jgi:hypothetical protein